jgi:hypothetical protein
MKSIMRTDGSEMYFDPAAPLKSSKHFILLLLYRDQGILLSSLLQRTTLIVDELTIRKKHYLNTWTDCLKHLEDQTSRKVIRRDLLDEDASVTLNSEPTKGPEIIEDFSERVVDRGFSVPLIRAFVGTSEIQGSDQFVIIDESGPSPGIRIMGSQKEENIPFEAVQSYQ